MADNSGTMTESPAQNLKMHGPEILGIAQRFGVRDVRVFGSIARGTSHSGSDIDLLVKMEHGRSLLDVIGFEQEVGDLLGVPVDVVEEGGVHPLLERRILAEARPI